MKRSIVIVRYRRIAAVGGSAHSQRARNNARSSSSFA